MEYKPYRGRRLPRFEGPRTFMRLKEVEEIPAGIDFAVLGVPIDGASTLDPGQRRGPAAIRDASVNRHGFDPELEIDIFDYLQGVDYGDVPVNPGYIEESYAGAYQYAGDIFRSDAIPVFLGGDHSCTLPELRAAFAKYGPVSLVVFDAHYDNNPSYIGKKYNHATWLYHAVEEGIIDPASSIQIGMRGSCGKGDRQRSDDLGLKTVTQSECFGMGLDGVIRTVCDRVGSNKYFCSFDIDFVDPASAPGTSTIEQGGYNSAQVLQLIQGLKELDLIGMDLVEVLPHRDHAGITADLASVVIWKFLSITAWRRKNGK